MEEPSTVQAIARLSRLASPVFGAHPHAQVKITARVHIEPDADKRVHREPVIFYLMQTVQNRRKPPKNAQVKITARVHIEPDVGKRVFIEPPVGKCE